MNAGLERSDPSNVARSPAGVVAEILVLVIGVALVVGAVVANQRWLDRHFLPSWFLPRHWYVVIESCVRVLMAAGGVWLIVSTRPRVGRAVTRAPARAASIAVAAALALGAGEVAIRQVHVGAAEWLAPDEEPRRERDDALGWTLVPGRTGHNTIGERIVDYAIDSSGCRVRSVDEPVDSGRPTILFVGESVMFGEGLTWEESVPARTGALLGIQSANLAVHGYGNDQAYLRLERELPRFRQPVAVVSLFMTALFGRNLDDDRPHLWPGLVWMPPVQHGRLATLAKLLVPYRRDATVERGIAATRDVFTATVKLAGTRGATPLVVVPHFGVEDDVERELRRRVLDEPGVPYVWVEIDDDWRLPGDRHPNARAAQVIAKAIADRLKAH